MNIEFTDIDGINLQLINWLAKDDYKKKKLCYQLKGILLEKYSTPDGYDLQTFTKPCWEDDTYGDYGDRYFSGETFSWHEHILARHKIGNLIFHSPTNDFSYSDINGHHKKSQNFAGLKSQCVGKLDDIQEVPKHFNKRFAIKALRQLIHKFKPLFRETIIKKERAKYPFIAVKHWSYSGDLDEFVIRVPHIACACGLKLTVTVNCWELARMKLGTFQTIKEIHCDEIKNENHYREDGCLNYLLHWQKRYGYQHLVPYESEIQQVSAWANDFFISHWEEFLPTMIGIDKRIDELMKDKEVAM